MFELEAHLPYLLNRVGHLIAVVFSEVLEAENLTVPMWRVMAVLWHDGSRTLSDLAQHTSIEVSTLSRLIGTLEGRRLVVRRRSKSNGRNVSIDLTAAGRRLSAQLIPSAMSLERKMVEGISAADIVRLRTLLGDLYNNLV